MTGSNLFPANIQFREGEIAASQTCLRLTHHASDFLYNKFASVRGLPLGKPGGNLTMTRSESEKEFPGETSLWHSEW